jgi:hypothetical protein
MTDYDTPWKEVLDLYFEPSLSFFFAEAHADIDWGRGCESLDKELQQIVREGELGRRLVDKLVKVWLKSGQEQWVLIHVEVQTSEEADFAKRMYVYNYRLFDRYNREVVSLAVLGDSQSRWHPDSFAYGRWGTHAELRFSVAKLLDYAGDVPALEANPNPFAAVVLAHLQTMQTRRDPGARYAWKVRLIKGLYNRGWSDADVLGLFEVIDWMMDLPQPLAASFWQEIKHYEEEKQMPFMSTPERIGREEGREEGLTKGRLEGLEVALELKFGEAGLALMPEIRNIADEKKLEAILRAVRSAASPDDLRRMWTG